ncbi:hypothetical protein BC829DRAFT_127253 [Chytridium lagenaria]|nr:hypothetical protein BC829DRAFT_127253 [Chytridium lagenaria]
MRREAVLLQMLSFLAPCSLYLLFSFVVAQAQELRNNPKIKNPSTKLDLLHHHSSKASQDPSSSSSSSSSSLSPTLTPASTSYPSCTSHSPFKSSRPVVSISSFPVPTKSSQPQVSKPMFRLSADLGKPSESHEKKDGKKQRRSFLQMFMMKDHSEPKDKGFKPFSSPSSTSSSLSSSGSDMSRSKSVATGQSSSRDKGSPSTTSSAASSRHTRSKSDSTSDIFAIPLDQRSQTAAPSLALPPLDKPIITLSPVPSVAPAAEKLQSKPMTKVEPEKKPMTKVEPEKRLEVKVKTKVESKSASPPKVHNNSKDCLPRLVRKNTAEMRKPTVNEQGRVRRRGAYGLDKLTRLDSYSSIYSIEPVRSYSTSSTNDSITSDVSSSDNFSFEFDHASLSQTTDPVDDDDGSCPPTPRAKIGFSKQRLPFHSLPRRRDTDRSESINSDSEDSYPSTVIHAFSSTSSAGTRVPTLKRIRTLKREVTSLSLSRGTGNGGVYKKRPAREILLETYADIVSELAELVPGIGDRRRLDLLGGSAAENMERLLEQFAEADIKAAQEQDQKLYRKPSTRIVTPFSVEFRNDVKEDEVVTPTMEDGVEETFVDEYIVEHWLPLSPTSSGSGTLPRADDEDVDEEF